MKKILLVMSAIVVAAGVANAQDIMSKKGTPIVYEAGDWGLGIDANPFLDFAGNAFNHDNNNAPTWNFTDFPMVITGLKVIDANTAYRGKLRLGFGSNKQAYVVNDDANQTATPTFITDEQKTSYSNITVGAGIQKMRGKHRVRGFYGVEALLGLEGSKTTNSYGNALSVANPDPTTGIPGQPSGPGRVTESKSGSSFMFSIRGFVGVEYFFAPKISLAGEFGWGPGLSSTAAGSTTIETFNSDGTAVTSISIDSPGKASSFSFDTDNNGGSLRMSFYF
jgi:hypothetical protein